MREKKDLLLEDFNAKLDKVDLSAIYGGGPVCEITETTQGTVTPDGTITDPKTDQYVAAE